MTNTHEQSIIEEALRQVRAGEIEAFETIVRTFERPIRAWLAGRAAPGVDVDEVAQRSFVTAYTRLDQYELGTNFSAWLFSIARYQLQTESTRIRRVADYRSRWASDLLSRELERQQSETPELFGIRLQNLKLCLESLGDSLRQFVDWRYRDEISLEEMSERSGRSVAAVKKQLWLLRNKLRKCVELRTASLD
ncbi:sigma-70 family RNA polymerase sigma factor [Blastopirellula sp. J2-11]|uniref:sigma-70 family RNA polymerase sigma factor n=1 Tax=Blastopirellula sp. J2-11 TaxID=2943192 RepID=UPI0021C65A40|nr:sigma-70 family RNA polymerase sigma factor [Blastopirellula sp. J2-11]UUO07173.1 sigma-70 family RNA polymerase sigma factor [Blastopirellula sp. J2-11]